MAVRAAPGPGTGGGAPVRSRATGAAPDYDDRAAEPRARPQAIQESLRTLDKYNGPIDGNLQSEATVKAIGDWQKGRGTAVVGKLTPLEAQQLNAEAAKAPIRRIEPSTQAAAPAAAPRTPMR